MTRIRRSDFLAGSAATAILSPRSARSETIGPLRVATAPNDPYASAYYAQDLGYFAKVGLDVKLLTFSNSSVIAEAITSGSADVGSATPLAVANAHLHGLPFVITTAEALSSSKVLTLGVCTAADSGITGPADLVGKTVAVNQLGAGSALVLDAWLARGGVDVTKVQIVESPFSAMKPGLLRGTFAAAVISEPTLAGNLQDGTIKVIGNPLAAVAPQFLITCWFSTTSFCQAHPDLIARFNRAIYATHAFVNGHPNATLPILAKYAKIDQQKLRHMVHAFFADGLRASDMQAYFDLAARFGAISRAFPAADIIYRPA